MSNFSKIFSELRRSKGLSQEKIAEQFSVTVQAVSKWECALSMPDISLIIPIARYFGVTADYLLTGEMREGTADLPDDDKLRIVQFRGNKLLKADEYDPETIIRLQIGENEADVEICGSAKIEGDINGDVTAGGTVVCNNVQGDVNAGSAVTCDDVEGDVNANGCVTCDDVEGDVQANGSVTCDNIEGDVNANGTVTCEDVGGDISTSSSVDCGNVAGDVTAGSVTCTGVDGEINIE